MDASISGSKTPRWRMKRVFGGVTMVKPGQRARLFDGIAPVYSLFYRYQKHQFRKALQIAEKYMDLSTWTHVLDVGCGTGALCSVMAERGYTVTGIDISEKMLEVGKRKKENEGIRFLLGSVLDGLPFPQKSYDVAIASYVAHGFVQSERKFMYQEMKRVSTRWVIIHDFSRRRSGIVDLIERAERSDYRNFIQVVTTELKAIFPVLKVIKIGPGVSWYVCQVNHEEDELCEVGEW